MKRINLLPPHIIQAHAGQRARRKYTILLGVLGLLFVALGGAAGIHVHVLDRRIHRAEQELAALDPRLEKLTVSELEHRQLTDRAATLHALQDPLPPAAVIALLTQVMPEGVAVRQLIIDAPLPSLAKPSSSAGRNAPRRGDAVPLLSIQIEGITSSSSTVPEIVRRFLASEVFNNVRLEDSQRMAERAAPEQRFRLLAEIPPALSRSADSPIAAQAAVSASEGNKQ